MKRRAITFNLVRFGETAKILKYLNFNWLKAPNRNDVLDKSWG